MIIALYICYMYITIYISWYYHYYDHCTIAFLQHKVLRFASCALLVGAVGAGMANLLFMPPGGADIISYSMLHTSFLQHRI